jgi:hypothetical protein
MLRVKQLQPAHNGCPCTPRERGVIPGPKGHTDVLAARFRSLAELAIASAVMAQASR